MVAQQKSSSLHKWSGLIVLSLALAIIVIDTTLLNVALGTIIKEFNTTIQSIQWVITAYALTLAALTITGGRLGDLFGRKRMFVLGAVIFAIGSYIASISNNVTTMVWGESIIEGIGAALMMPATSSLLLSNYEGRDRAIAFGIWGGIAAAASAIGPILGGYLTTHYSWRWGFRINIFVAAAVLLGSYLIKEARDARGKTDIDWVGVLLSSTGLLAFVFGIIESSSYGWWKAKEIFTFGNYQFQGIADLSIVPYALALGVLLLALFVSWESMVEERGKTPLVSLKLFQNRQFATGTLTTMIMSLGLTGLIFALPVFLQSVKELNAYDTGMALLPMSITILIFAPLSAFLSTKIKPKYLIQIGLLVNAIGIYVLRQMLSVDATATTLIPGLIVFGAGIGITMAQISNITLSAVSVEQAGEASGVNNTLRQVGSAFGSAVIGAVMLSALSTNLSNGIARNNSIPQALKTRLTETITSQSSAIEFGGTTALTNSLPAAIRNQIITISHESVVDASKTALIYATLFALLGFLFSFTLPNIEPQKHGISPASH